MAAIVEDAKRVVEFASHPYWLERDFTEDNIWINIHRQLANHDRAHDGHGVRTGGEPSFGGVSCGNEIQ